MLSDLADEEGAVSGSRRCVMLAGVYRGGADALSRIFAHLGVDQAGETSNFAERLAELNQAILKSAGFEPTSIEPFHAGWYASLRHAEFYKRAVALIRSNFAASSLFVLKDSSIGPLVPFWRNVLKACEVEAVVLDFYEDPAGYADALLQSDGVAGEAARTVWLARVIESERASRGLVRAQLTQEALLDDWEAALARLSQGLDVTWPAWSARVRKQIVGELIDTDDTITAPGARKAPHADQIGRWRQAAQDIIWRWAREGEDERGRARLDELGLLFDEAREFVGIAFATVAEMGGQLRLHKHAADDLLTRVAALQHQSDALEANAEAQAGVVAELQAALAKLEAERDRLAALPRKDKDELAKVEAKWAEIFRSSRDQAAILTEQNGVFQAAIERLTAEVGELEGDLRRANAAIERLRLIEIAQKAEVGSARSEVVAARSEASEIRKSLAEAQERVARLRTEAGSREATIERLQNELLARAATAAPAAGSSARSSAISLSPQSLIQYLKPKTRKKLQRHKQVRQMVAASGLFDAQFYAARYPDVVAAGGDLLDHFIQFGGAEGRHPSLSFNSKWYLSENPDIRSAGLNPLVHYLEHGRDEGRRRRSLVDAATVSAAMAEASAAPTSEPQSHESQVSPPADVRAAQSELEPASRPRTGRWKALLSPDFGRRSAIVPLAELSALADARPIAVGGDMVASFADDTPPEALGRIALFGALRPGDAAPLTVAGEHPAQSAPHVWLAGPGLGLGLLADGWWDSEAVLTLRLSDGFSGVARVFQTDDADRLQCVAEAVLDGGEVDLVEARLVDPLAPLLIVLARRDGALAQSAVVPFPSLLRGGLHYGELAVLETAPGSMATLAEYSQVLALEWLGWPEGPGSHAIGRIDIDMRGASGTEPIFRPAVLGSIARRFGIVLSAQGGSYAPQRAPLAAMLDAAKPASEVAARQGATGSLVLPSDCVPSIYAMVARRLPHDLSLSRFAVVDAATARPQADVALPFDESLAALQHADMPAHAPFVLASGEGQAGGGGPIFPLAVRHYNKLAWQADPLMPVSPDQDMPTGGGARADKAVTVIIDAARDADSLANCLLALGNQVGAERLDVIVAGWPEGASLPFCELPIRTIDDRGLTLAGRYNAAAELSDADLLMVLAPSVLLSDPRTIATLAEVANRPGTASAACALVTEMPDDAHVTVHSAGYFPTRVSLHGEPVFDFDQLDIARAMPAATFPVVANHAKCVMYDAAVFRSLGGFDAQRFPMAMHDLDLGFRALAAGHTNLCTTLVRAAVDNASPSADFPDPLAHRSVRPADWQSLLDRVTVVRELRR